MAKSLKVITKAYTTHANTILKRSVLLHQTNVDALRRVQEFGDLSAFIFGANALAKTGIARADTLKWMQKHGRCKLIPQTDGTVSFTMKDKAKWDTIDVDKADKSPFYDIKRGERAEAAAKIEAMEAAGEEVPADLRELADDTPKVKTFNLMGRIKSSLGKAEKINSDHSGYDMTKTDTGSEDFVAAIQQVLNTFDPSANTNDTPVFDMAARRSSVG